MYLSPYINTASRVIRANIETCSRQHNGEGFSFSGNSICFPFVIAYGVRNGWESSSSFVGRLSFDGVSYCANNIQYLGICRIVTALRGVDLSSDDY